MYLGLAVALATWYNSPIYVKAGREKTANKRKIFTCLFKPWNRQNLLHS